MEDCYLLILPKLYFWEYWHIETAFKDTQKENKSSYYGKHEYGTLDHETIIHVIKSLTISLQVACYWKHYKISKLC